MDAGFTENIHKVIVIDAVRITSTGRLEKSLAGYDIAVEAF